MKPDAHSYCRHLLLIGGVIASFREVGDINPLGIATFLNFQLGGGWYVGNGDMVALYDWDSAKFFLPLGVRAGKVIVNEKASWNVMESIGRAGFTKAGSALPFNVTYTMPID